MTAEQRKWLAENPKFAPVPAPSMRGTVTLTQWTDEGLLYPGGHFAKFAGPVTGVPYMRNVLSDGQTLFAGTEKALRVGREYFVN